jgi:aminoglycoside 6'-N-acetyltransferase I
MADLGAEPTECMRAAAAILRETCAETIPAWTDACSALERAHEALGRGRLARVAIDEDESVAGWIGAVRDEGGSSWRVDLIAVKVARQRQGVGTALLADLEDRVAALGGLALWARLADRDASTTLGATELYPEVLTSASRLESSAGHPFQFFTKAGFRIAGVLPDASGLGCPDILLVKRPAARAAAGVEEPVGSDAGAASADAGAAVASGPDPGAEPQGA